MRIARSHSTSATSAEKGSRIAAIAARCPPASASSARHRLPGARSISAEETARGQPMPGLSP